MPTKNIQRGPSAGGAPAGFINGGNANDVYVDGATDQLVVGTGASGSSSQTMVGRGDGISVTLMAAFVEDATTLTHTATFPVPAGAILEDIIFLSTVLWGGGTVALTIGDANAANGWFLSTNLKATDLLVGERLQAASSNNWGGLNGAYLTTAGRFGQQSGNMIGGYCPTTAYSVIMVITVTTPAVTTGRSFGFITYQLPATTAAVTPVKA